MKKKVLSIISLFATSLIMAQSIPNGGFENWNTTNFESLLYYTSSNLNENHSAGVVNVVQTTDAFHGNYAVKLTTTLSGSDTVTAYTANGDPTQIQGQGIPYTQQPTSMRLYYKSNIMPGDTGLVILIFKSGGSVISQNIQKIAGTQTTYSLLTINLNLPSAPDSLLFAVTASNAFVFKGIPGSMLQIDSVTFTGFTSQPTMMNGDFEFWQPQTYYQVQGWNTSQVGVSQTTDVFAGNYAIELTTYEDQNNNDTVYSAQASTGHQNSTNNMIVGGYPFTNTIDTLAFHYKYAPADPADSASIFIQFSKNGSPVGGAGKLFPAASTYTLAQIPIQLAIAPDSVIVFLNSSKNGFKLPLSFVGSDLKVDNIYFKSQPLNNNTTGLKSILNQDNIGLWPNPTSGIFNLSVQELGTVQKVSIYDALGNLIDTKAYTNGLKSSDSFDARNLNSGIYLIQIQTTNGVFSNKLNKVN